VLNEKKTKHRVFTVARSLFPFQITRFATMPSYQHRVFTVARSSSLKMLTKEKFLSKNTLWRMERI
jgi:hypothetical protein